MSDPRCTECGWCLTVRSIKDSEPETICTRCCWSSIAERLRTKVAELEAALEKYERHMVMCETCYQYINGYPESIDKLLKPKRGEE